MSNKAFGIFLFSVMIAIISGNIYFKNKESSDLLSDLRTLATKDLRDPTSTQFRNEQHHGEWLCGELNSKNGYGAYGGFKRFMSKKPDEAYLEDEGILSEDQIKLISHRQEVEIEALNIRGRQLDHMHALRVKGGGELQPGFHEFTHDELQAQAEKIVFERKWGITCRH
jgi:hypothetical protein